MASGGAKKGGGLIIGKGVSKDRPNPRSIPMKGKKEQITVRGEGRIPDKERGIFLTSKRRQRIADQMTRKVAKETITTKSCQGYKLKGQEKFKPPQREGDDPWNQRASKRENLVVKKGRSRGGEKKRKPPQSTCPY